MSRVISAGFIVKCKNGQFLLGKACYDGNDKFTIFKGRQDPGESLIETAIRELKEESGIDINVDDRLNKNISTVPIFTYSMRDKDVYVFLLNDSEGALDDFEFKCDSYYGETVKYPEIIDYKRFDLDDMDKYIFHSQLGLIELLKNKRI